jgi:hypothetical protein
MNVTYVVDLHAILSKGIEGYIFIRVQSAYDTLSRSNRDALATLNMLFFSAIIDISVTLIARGNAYPSSIPIYRTWFATSAQLRVCTMIKCDVENDLIVFCDRMCDSDCNWVSISGDAPWNFNSSSHFSVDSFSLPRDWSRTKNHGNFIHWKLHYDESAASPNFHDDALRAYNARAASPFFIGTGWK